MVLRVVVKRFSSTRRMFHASAKVMATVAEPQFLGIQNRFTDTLQFINQNSYEPIPIYRSLTASSGAELHKELQLDNETLIKMYTNMVTISSMDKILYESQRQGRISFYMTTTGEEAIQIGSAAALNLSDMVYAQYREYGVLLWRGSSISYFMNQCYGNFEDQGKGKQMPVHYGSRELNFVTLSSPLATQIPQAVGTAYSFKRSKPDACVICYFGDGAASEGDAHAAFNFAATLSCPVIFFCRNNGYAISTPTSEQYGGDGIAARGPAYGMHTTRVDGNDIFAVYRATKAARELCIAEKKPVLIEAMTYRMGHHSTSDDSTAYRASDEIAAWDSFSPINKLRLYLEHLGIWSQEKDDSLRKSIREEILKEFAKAEKRLKPNWREVFTDVYKKTPPHIRKQMAQMEKHVEEYRQEYPVNEFKES